MTIDQINTFFAKKFSATIHITNYCNLRCKPCGANCSPDMPKQYMRKTSVNGILLRIHESKLFNDVVGIDGGEALTALQCDKDYFKDILKFAKKLGLAIWIKSNGTIVYKPEWKDFRKLLLKYDVGLDISLNEYTPGTLKSCTKILKDLKSTKAMVRISYTYLEDKNHVLVDQLAKNTGLKFHADYEKLKLYLGKYLLVSGQGIYNVGRAKENGLGTKPQKTLEEIVTNKRDGLPYMNFNIGGTADVGESFAKYCPVPFVANNQLRQFDEVIADMKKLMISQYVEYTFEHFMEDLKFLDTKLRLQCACKEDTEFLDDMLDAEDTLEGKLRLLQSMESVEQARTAYEGLRYECLLNARTRHPYM